MDSLIRVGTVSSVDEATRTARVSFLDLESPLVSGTLRVLKNAPFLPAKDVPQQTEEKAGGGGDAAYESHSHAVVVSPWLPSVGDFVVCLFLPNGEGDGFVIGGL